jgi:hypothetical protein
MDEILSISAGLVSYTPDGLSKARYLPVGMVVNIYKVLLGKIFLNPR